MDIRFPRPIERLQRHITGNYPEKSIIDEGNYFITQKDDQSSAERKLLQGMKEHAFSFSLMGEKLKGRFSIKETKTGVVLQKLKDKHAFEEDVLSADLSRTVANMIPGFSVADFLLHRARKPKTQRDKQNPLTPNDPVTADKKIGNNNYHFEFYRSSSDGKICLVSNSKNDALVLLEQPSGWEILSPIGKLNAKLKKIIREHTQILFTSQET